MVVFQHPNGCEYEVQWPSPVGCPATPVLHTLGLQDQQGTSTSWGKTLLAVFVVLGGLGNTPTQTLSHELLPLVSFSVLVFGTDCWFFRHVSAEPLM